MAARGQRAPHRLLVAARIDLADGLSTDEVECAWSEIDQEVRERVPGVWQVFLDATPRNERGLTPVPSRPDARPATS